MAPCLPIGSGPDVTPWPGRSDGGRRNTSQEWQGTAEVVSQEPSEIHTRRGTPACPGIAREALLVIQRKGRLVGDRLAGEGAQRPAVQIVAGVLEDQLRID